jgi:hypothetical protein
MDLPIQPGHARRRAYGNYVRRRNSRLRSSRPPFLSNRTVQFDIYSRDEPFSYERLSELQQVYVGMNVSDLVAKSYISISSKNELCVVCQDYMLKEKHIIRILHCNHIFHVNCIDRWFCDNCTCPLCKFSCRK